MQKNMDFIENSQNPPQHVSLISDSGSSGWGRPLPVVRGTFQEYRQLYLTEPQSKLQMFLA